MGPLDTWRTATSVLPRRTALRLLGASALSVAVAACSSGKVGPGLGAVALGKFAAGRWQVSAPEAHYKHGTVDVTETGTWTASFDDEEGQDPTVMSGTWSPAGKSLQVTIAGHGDGDGGTATGVPETVAGGDASAAFSWVLAGREKYPDDIRANYRAKTGTLVLEVGVGPRPQHPQTITLTRA
ncbi:hypothetical protein [Kitasatospora sp. NPDC004272]